MIVVAVCARPEAPLLGDCLAALARAGVTAPVVETAAAGHGLAVARNAALERAGAGDVIAYVDDDVLVGAGWLHALEAAWAAAPASVAAIGGPLETVVRGSRPGWLGDELLAGLGVTAPAGSGPFDPSRRTLPGGNLTFRASALRGVGGFWPARGRAAARDWFTEEHEVQRELGRAGWELRQDDALAARRVVDGGRVTRRGIVAARARSGARQAVLGGAVRPGARQAVAGGGRSPRGAARGSAVLGGGRSPGGVARDVARSASGALLAAARGDSGLAVARAARAAEHAGTLAGPLLAHAETQPVARRTPFRHAIAAPRPSPLRAQLAHLPRRPRRTEPLVLALHRVADVESDPLSLALAPARFAALLDRLRAERTPAPLEAIVAGEAPADAVAVTLDDGYVDNLTVALPLLEAADVPATVFVSTGHVEEGRAFWWDELGRLLRAAAAPAAGDPLRVELAGDHRAWPARTPAERAVASAHLFAWLPAHLPEAIDAALDAIAAWAGVERGVDDADRPMTIDELRRLAASPLITIGAHGRTHPSLALVEPERRDEELHRSRDDLAAWLGVAPTAFAYPFGAWGTDVDAATRDAVAAAGYACAVVNTVDVPRGDHLLIPRAPGGAYAAQASPGP